LNFVEGFFQGVDEEFASKNRNDGSPRGVIPVDTGAKYDSRCKSPKGVVLIGRSPIVRRGVGSHVHGRQRMDLDHDKEQLVETLFRNGTLTVSGIVLSFSLGFLAQWGANPLPWRLWDAPPVLALIAGIVIQFRALWMLLGIESLKRHIFEKANKQFFIGAAMTGTGVFLAICMDLAELAVHGHPA
jgi:hypothetical protein